MIKKKEIDQTIALQAGVADHRLLMLRDTEGVRARRYKTAIQ